MTALNFRYMYEVPNVFNKSGREPKSALLNVLLQRNKVVLLVRGE